MKRAKQQQYDSLITFNCSLNLNPERANTLKEEKLNTHIIETLIEVAPEITPEEINPAVSFRDQFEIDSIDFLNFILTLEKKLGIKIPELDYPTVQSARLCRLSFSKT